MDTKQIEMIACPECQSRLSYNNADKELVCSTCQLAFPVRDGIPVMLVEEARRITVDKKA